MKSISNEKRQRLFLEAQGHCIYCGKEIANVRAMTVDHIVPKTLGGSSKYSNLVCCCNDCNSLKDHIPLRDLINVMPCEKKKRYFNRIQHLYQQGCISFEKRELLLGVSQELHRRQFNLRFLFLRIHCEVVVRWDEDPL